MSALFLVKFVLLRIVDASVNNVWSYISIWIVLTDNEFGQHKPYQLSCADFDHSRCIITVFFFIVCKLLFTVAVDLETSSLYF